MEFNRQKEAVYYATTCRVVFRTRDLIVFDDLDHPLSNVRWRARLYDVNHGIRFPLLFKLDSWFYGMDLE